MKTITVGDISYTVSTVGWVLHLDAHAVTSSSAYIAEQVFTRNGYKVKKQRVVTGWAITGEKAMKP